MPRPEINDYLFYKIVNEELPDYVYIGSTGCFIKRKQKHKDACNNPNSKSHNFKLYKTIRDNGGWEKWNMIVIDKLDKSTLIDSRIKEEELRREYNANMNTIKAHTSVDERKEYIKDYYHANKEAKNEKLKDYYQANKEVIAEKQKNYYHANKESIIEKQKNYYYANKEALNEYSKNYRQANKEVIAEKQKNYYQDNKEVIDEKRSKKMTCVCGSIFRKDAVSSHNKTQTHQNFCKSIELSDT